MLLIKTSFNYYDVGLLKFILQICWLRSCHMLMTFYFFNKNELYVNDLNVNNLSNIDNC